jgi:hypothetical protein
VPYNHQGTSFSDFPIFSPLHTFFWHLKKIKLESITLNQNSKPYPKPYTLNRNRGQIFLPAGVTPFLEPLMGVVPFL